MEKFSPRRRILPRGSISSCHKSQFANLRTKFRVQHRKDRQNKIFKNEESPHRTDAITFTNLASLFSINQNRTINIIYALVTLSFLHLLLLLLFLCQNFQWLVATVIKLELIVDFNSMFFINLLYPCTCLTAYVSVEFLIYKLIYISYYLLFVSFSFSRHSFVFVLRN